MLYGQRSSVKEVSRWLLWSGTARYPVTVRLLSILTTQVFETHERPLRAVTTAIFATCGMGVFTFLGAAFLALPKQFAAVYLGTGKVDDNGERESLPIISDPRRPLLTFRTRSRTDEGAKDRQGRRHHWCMNPDGRLIRNALRYHHLLQFDLGNQRRTSKVTLTRFWRVTKRRSWR